VDKVPLENFGAGLDVVVLSKIMSYTLASAHTQ